MMCAIVDVFFLGFWGGTRRMHGWKDFSCPPVPSHPPRMVQPPDRQAWATLPRQSTNIPYATRQGTVEWPEWIDGRVSQCCWQSPSAYALPLRKPERTSTKGDFFHREANVDSLFHVSSQPCINSFQGKKPDRDHIGVHLPSTAPIIQRLLCS